MASDHDIFGGDCRTGTENFTFDRRILSCASFRALPWMSVAITSARLSSCISASRMNFLGRKARPIVSSICLKTGTISRRIQAPSCSCMEFNSGRLVLFSRSKSMHFGESFSHILTAWPFARRTPSRVLERRNGAPISHKWDFTVLLSDMRLLRLLLPTIKSTVFDARGVPSSAASCVVIIRRTT